jgi:hypothetical protein
MQFVAPYSEYVNIAGCLLPRHRSTQFYLFIAQASQRKSRQDLKTDGAEAYHHRIYLISIMLVR